MRDESCASDVQLRGRSVSHGESFRETDKIKDQKPGTDGPIEAFKNQYCYCGKAFPQLQCD